MSLRDRIAMQQLDGEWELSNENERKEAYQKADLIIKEIKSDPEMAKIITIVPREKKIKPITAEWIDEQYQLWMEYALKKNFTATDKKTTWHKWLADAINKQREE